SAIAWIVIKRHHGDIQNIRWGELNTEIDSLDDSIGLIEEQVEDIIKNSLSEVEKIYEEIFIDCSIKEFFDKIKNGEKFFEKLKRDLKRLCRRKSIEYFFNVLFFYSILLDADKLDASGTKIPQRIKDIHKSIIEFYKQKKIKRKRSAINKIRERAYQEVIKCLDTINLKKEKIFSINLPTGIGKTLTGLSFSLGLREKIENEMGFIPRIIYCLPFISIIDQNSKIIEEIYRLAGKYKKIPSNLFLKHHHLTDISYVEEKNGELNSIKDLNRSLLLTEGWNSEIIITTFVQFFHSLITNRNRAARKFHNIVNSIIILDEVQSIPYKYWLLIEEALTYLTSKFNCWIVLMTATQPLLFQNKKIKQLIKKRETYFNEFDRVKFFFDINSKGEFKEKEFELFKEEIYYKIQKNRNLDFMIILNTISTCKNLYEFLKDRFTKKYHLKSKDLLDEDGVCNFPDFILVNLSTNILPSFRLKRIDRIKNDPKRKIIITTQLIEAGVDISVDVIYRDMAPLDCLIQSAGRCNRNNKEKKGNVYVILLRDKKRKIYSYVYDPFLIDVTKEVIQQFGINTSEKEFILKATTNYYNLIKERGTTVKSKEILDSIKKLNFSDISKFKLIEEKIPTISIFVEINNKAKKIREKIEKILSLEKSFKKREEILKIRKNINKYTVAIRVSRKTKVIESLPFLEGEYFRYVPLTKLKKWYRLDTGVLYS
ncbi:MAG: CRISPR-associated helicase/endonuclease Cas3, partial [Candidatus Odinarchaeia archaeon]